MGGGCVFIMQQYSKESFERHSRMCYPVLLASRISLHAYHWNFTRVRRINVCRPTTERSSSRTKARSCYTTLGNYTFNGFRQFSHQHDTKWQRTRLVPSWPFSNSGQSPKRGRVVQLQIVEGRRLVQLF